ncbi:DUF5694 domain-containing protein [Mucilaginibacter aquaedulcis]|uniref:DUF5694 domain-containing protein n=1 Tax=Mucilaginibacter aquaedulcis TaxID=1187081 RepID=UPI0025B43075|nr:DUF5694 domain-containing protein [Mucilaginibacter aquaedulcis]MDN3550045.1 DUF5694 domain-containing protein [Mucilaginibacter aquaedulcis]
MVESDTPTIAPGFFWRTEQNSKPAVQLLLLGTFHFSNPGLDAVKFKSADINSDTRQKEIQQLVGNIKKFKPDKIFIEAGIDQQALIDSQYNAYLSGNYKLSANETNQVGFRLAKELGHKKVYCIDYWGTQFPFDSLLKVAKQNRQDELLNSINDKITAVGQEFNAMLLKSTIQQLLAWENTDAMNAENVGFYFKLLKAGDLKNHVGSYLTSEWYRRNLIIYEQMLKELDGREKRIFLMFGQGHTAMIKQFVQYNHELELVPVADVLK